MTAGTVPTATQAPTPSVASGAPSGGGRFTGTATLARLVLRRDRVRLPVWIVGISLFTVGTAASFPATYPSAADRRVVAQTMDLPAAVAMLGPNYAGPEHYTYGAMLAHQSLVFTSIAIGVMSVLLLVRHTRAEEESGRSELVRAGVVGRHAQPAAALLVVGGAHVVLALVQTVGLAASGIDSITWGGSLLFSASLAAVGLVFAGVTAVTVQVTEHIRAASGMAMAVLGGAYAVRAVGDVGSGTLTWLSPIGWAQQTHSFAAKRWWPLLLAIALTGLLVATAFELSTRRDVGAGLRHPRGGAAAASDRLADPLGLALRLQRASLAAWAAALLLLGVMYGSILGGAEDMLADIEAMQDMLPDVAGAAVVDSFVAMVVSVLAMITSVQAVLAVLRLRSEESSGRAEPLLATALSRTRWAAGHLFVALAGSAAVILLAGLGLGLAGAVVIGDAGLVGRALGGSAAQVAAIWVTVGVAMALYGWVPRAAHATWAVVVYAFLVVYLGAFLQLPDGLGNLSPFGHVPQVPAEPFRATPVLVLVVVAAALVALGLAGLRRRDLRSTA